MNHLFGEKWREYWLLYVDDALPFGDTKLCTGHRMRLLKVAMKVLGKTLSDKLDDQIGEKGHCAGLDFVEDGVAVDDSAVQCSDAKVLSDGEQKWLTFEEEAYGMKRALVKWAGLFMRVAQLGIGRWPPLLWMDSTLALQKWLSLGVPAKLDDANSKAIRLMNRYDDVSYVQAMDFDMRWIPGSFNDFADLLSRLAGLIMKGVGETKARVMMPVVGESVGMSGVPDGYRAESLELKGDDAWRR